MPLNLSAQTTANQDALKMVGKKVSLQKISNRKASKMSVQSFSEMRTKAAQNKSGVAKEKNAQGTEMTYIVLNVEFKTAAARRAVFTDQKQSKLPDATVLTAIEQFADVFISTDAAWDALSNNPNVLKVEYSSEVVAPPPPVSPSTLQSQAVAESIVRGGYKGLTGKNVIVAVLDTALIFVTRTLSHTTRAGFRKK